VAVKNKSITPGSENYQHSPSVLTYTVFQKKTATLFFLVITSANIN